MTTPQFSVTPMTVLTDPDLKPMDKALYALLSGYAQAGRGDVRPRQDTLSKALGVTVRHVKRSLVALEKAEYLIRDRTRKGNGDFGRNVYTLRGFDVRLQVDPAGDTDVPSESAGDTDVPSQGTQMSHREQYNHDHDHFLLEPEPEKPAKKPRKKPATKTFEKPAQEQVEEWFINAGVPARAARILAIKYMGHYESNGWVVGKARTPMKSWQGACKTFLGRWHEDNPVQQPKDFTSRWTVQPGQAPDPYGGCRE